MKLGVVGDSHGDQAALRKALAAAPPVDRWLHTGDWSQDAWVLDELSGLPVLAVAGNTDAASGRANDEELIDVAGHKLWLTHGHRYLAYGKNGLLERAKMLGADIIVYGHTHVPEAGYYGGKFLLNPGSVSRPRGGSKAGFAVLTLGQKIEAVFINI